MLPPRPGKRVAARPPCTASAARINVLDGTQPTLTQVPPITPWPISATFAPSSAAVIAAEKPAEPAPPTAPPYPSTPGRLRQPFIGYRFLKARWRHSFSFEY